MSEQVEVFGQPTLPGEFEPPPPECPVNKTSGTHHFAAIQSYSNVRYWSVSAYEPFCLYCGLPEQKSKQ